MVSVEGQRRHQGCESFVSAIADDPRMMAACTAGDGHRLAAAYGFRGVYAWRTAGSSDRSARDRSSPRRHLLRSTPLLAVFAASCPRCEVAPSPHSRCLPCRRERTVPPSRRSARCALLLLHPPRLRSVCTCAGDCLRPFASIRESQGQRRGEALDATRRCADARTERDRSQTALPSRCLAIHRALPSPPARLTSAAWPHLLGTLRDAPTRIRLPPLDRSGVRVDRQRCPTPAMSSIHP